MKNSRAVSEKRGQKTSLSSSGNPIEKGAATREDIHELRDVTREDIHELREAAREDINGLGEDLRRVEKLTKRLASGTETRLIKWMFGIWISNVALIFGIVYAIIRATG